MRNFLCLAILFAAIALIGPCQAHPRPKDITNMIRLWAGLEQVDKIELGKKKPDYKSPRVWDAEKKQPKPLAAAAGAGAAA